MNSRNKKIIAIVALIVGFISMSVAIGLSNKDIYNKILSFRTNTQATEVKAEEVEVKTEAQEPKVDLAVEVVDNKDLKILMDKTIKETGMKDISVYVKSLKTGEEYRYRSHVKRHPASTIKALVAYIALGSGKDYNKSYLEPYTNQKLILGDVIKKAVADSNNTSLNYLLRMFGGDFYKKGIKNLGLKETGNLCEIMGEDRFSTYSQTLKRYGTAGKAYTTASDLGLMFEKYYYDYLDDKPGMKELFKNLSVDNIHHDRIPMGIDYKSPVAHKTGTVNDLTVADAGVVMKEGHPYIVSVMIGNMSEYPAAEAIRNISAALYEYFQ